MTDTPTVHVAVGRDFDTDQPFAVRCDHDYWSGSDQTFEVDVPAVLMEALDVAWKQVDVAINAVFDAAGYDPDEGKLATACDAYDDGGFDRDVDCYRCGNDRFEHVAMTAGVSGD